MKQEGRALSDFILSFIIFFIAPLSVPCHPSILTIVTGEVGPENRRMTYSTMWHGINN